MLRNVDCIALRTMSDGIRRRKRCTCVNMGDNNINVKTVVERVSVNMGDRGLGVKTVYEPKTISIMI